MKKNLSVLLLTVTVIAACLPQTATNFPVTAQQGSPTPTTVLINTLTPAPSATMAVISPDLERNCIPISSAPPNMKIEGVALFLDPRAPFIVSMGESEFPIRIGSSDQSVSPNNKFLAYRQLNNGDFGDVVIVTPNGTIITKFVKEFAGSLPGGDWISDEYIRYLVRSETDSNQTGMLARNIRTGEVHELRTDFPDMGGKDRMSWGSDNAATYHRNEKGADVVYDPSLSRVAYPKNGSYISLYDAQNNLELAEIKVADYGYEPIWSPNGQYFSFKGSDPTTRFPDIYIVSRDEDQFTPLTRLSKFFPEVRFGTYSWSPDSQQIAFWVKTTNEYGYDDSLLLLNLATMKMTDICIQGLGSWGSITGAGLADLGVAEPSPRGDNFILAGKPVWSPDSRKILIAQFDAERQQVVDILIDLENKIAYPIATDLEPMGWMSSDP